MSHTNAGDNWGRTASGWERWAKMRAVLEPATERMIDLAGIGPGARVLDIGCGAGEQTILAARRVGPSGLVLATDIAAPMLAATERAIAAAGLGNVSTRVSSAETLTLSGPPFDAAISRYVLMLVPDPVAAARGVFGMLRPGGRFGALVHGASARNPLNALATEILARHGGKTLRPDAPGFFALADPARLVSVLRDAGFEDVAVTPQPFDRKLDNAAMAVDMIRDAFAVCVGLIADLPAAEQAAAWAEVEAALSVYQRPEGLIIPAEASLVIGRRPDA
jgi:ubiquinone/menaquinone biosynthesis C-methylase UbiE